jgi:hypothetical protein
LSESTELEWSSPLWNSENCILIEGDKVNSDNKMFITSRWNKNSLYFFIKVTDNDLTAYQTEQDHSKLYMDDMVEILIDTQNDKDSCWAEDDIVYHINLFGVKKDDRGSLDCISNSKWNGKADIVVSMHGTVNDTTDVDSGYLVSVIFTWDEIGLEPEKGLTMGINFANCDNDGKGLQLFDWVNINPFRSPFAFGNLILE